MIAWILVVCMYGGNGANAGSSCVVVPGYYSYEDCTKARAAVNEGRGWRATCVWRPR